MRLNREGEIKERFEYVLNLAITFFLNVLIAGTSGLLLLLVVTSIQQLQTGLLPYQHFKLYIYPPGRLASSSLSGSSLSTLFGTSETPAFTVSSFAQPIPSSPQSTERFVTVFKPCVNQILNSPLK
ncbi:hypothetical protein DY000_02046353 [Brassica cretica]|uniref:Uncharacterized protein n=1 Tax=Brassica cretica TaxID=69181 RepID=A0ABQ7F6C4_BRACR|nr:hypothetical protein DY000_02046353 [Brassica cretica]